jgi:xylan 1,4-beta-xylosidase
MRRFLLFTFAVLGAAFAQAPAPAPETIRIDPRASAKPFPHFWEQTFGSGRANLSLRDSYRRDLDLMKKSTGIEYVRFHAIFQDENGVYTEDKDGNPVYNWSYVDQIYDGLVERGLRPFVELSFMPRQLAARESLHPFWYKQNVAPPEDWSRWGELVERFTRHVLERYGIEQVSDWYFEVWNEPNIDFWAGEPKFDTYMRLYAEAARAVKKVHPKLRVGGPATAQAAWVDRFIDWCVKNKVPLDFASTHVYANDTSQDVLGTNETIPRRDMMARAVRKVYDQVKRSPRPDLPIIWTEYNATYKNEVAVTDSPFMGPWLANNIRACDGMVTSIAYWTFSDVFEEQGIVRSPFYGGYGLIAAGGIPKAAFNAFQLLHRLGTERIPNSSESVIVTRRKDGTLAIALWNYFEPEQAGTPREFRLEFTGTAPKLRISIVDKQRGNPLEVWKAMGNPQFPTREQQAELRKAAVLAPPAPITGTSVTLQPHALALIESEP